MRVGFIADVHVGNHRGCGGAYTAGINERCAHVIESLAASIELAKEQDCDCVVIAGDLFDTVRPSPQIVAAVGRALSKAPRIPVHLLMGNHDRNSNQVDDHALGPLALAPNVVVWNEPDVLLGRGGAALVMVPFQAGPASVWLPEVLKGLSLPQQESPKTTLALHLGLHDAATRRSTFWAAGSDDAISVEQLDDLMQEYDIDVAMAGNWHGYKVWEMFDAPAERARYQVQIGALVPTGWDNVGGDDYYGSLVIVDHRRDEAPTRHVVPGPRFWNVSTGDELGHLMEEFVDAPETKLYVRWTCEPDEVCLATTLLMGLKHAGQLEGFDVRMDSCTASDAAREAALATRSPELIEASLAKFVASMPLDSSVSRDWVFNKAKEMLK